MKNVRVRFAPSPTGFLHIGGLRTALFSWLFAKKNNGRFVLRIEDTDRARIVDGSVESIIEALKWYGLDYDEGPDKVGKYGPYYQSERLDIYKKHADELIENGKAYYCFCSSERLEKIRKEQASHKVAPCYDKHCRNIPKAEINKRLKSGEPRVVRMKLPEEGTIVINDLIRGKVEFSFVNLDDAVIIKSDGYPTYQLANVVDDHLMKISHVIRAEEWLPSAPKHVWLYQAFGWKTPEMAHLPLILSPKGGKLSKRDGAVSALEYREKGYLAEAILNFIVLLGWNPKTEKEIFSLNELIDEFSLNKVNKAGAVFNIDRLNYLNGYYIRSLKIEKLTEYCLPFYKKENIPVNDIKYLEKVTKLFQERLITLNEIGELSGFVFKAGEYDSDILTPKKSNKETTIKYLQYSKGIINKLDDDNFTAENIKNEFMNFIKSKSLKTGEILWPLRVALSGSKTSPDVFDIAEVLKKEETLARINAAINKL